MREKIALFVLVIALAACRHEVEVVVYEAGPHLAQCAPPALTLAQSATKLTTAGVEVLRSSCGHIEGVMYPAVCGAGTGQVLLHDIPAASLPAAEAAGFAPADAIGESTPGTGYRRSSCAYYIGVIEIAQQSASCADVRNRVFVIQETAKPDEHMLLLDQAGNCADASYRQVLYGDTADEVLCSNADSIAGPQKSCTVAARAGLFDLILANLDESDLGLGSAYSVQQVFSGN